MSIREKQELLKQIQEQAAAIADLVARISALEAAQKPAKQGK